MSYEYVKSYYGFLAEAGCRILHDETCKEGTITPENHSCSHYVMVQFDGADFSIPCHPLSLQISEVKA